MRKIDKTTGRFLKTHGMTNTRLFSIWSGIKNRCYNKNKDEYIRYGAAGIGMCEEWLEDFMNFYNWSMNNGYADDLSIDRIDNSKGYSPDNCRWVDKETQTLNRSCTKWIEIDGKYYTIPQIAEKYGINKYCLYARAKKYGYTKDILKSPEIPRYLYRGKMYRLKDLAKITGLSEQTVLYRIKSGWDMDKIGLPTKK